MARHPESKAPKGKSRAPKGSGGKGRRALAGKGPTPKAEDRTYHPAYKAKKRREAAEAQAQSRQKRGRGLIKLKPGHELVVGRNPVAEAVAAGIQVARVFVTSSALSDDRVNSVIQAATAMGAPILEVPRVELDEACEGAANQGIAIEVPEYEYLDFEELWTETARPLKNPLFVALDGVTDPHNLGAILRNCGAFDVDGVIIPERRSAGVNATAWKVSAGAAARVPVAREVNLVRALEAAKEKGCFVVGLAGDADAEVGDFNLATEPLVIVTGAEGKGLSRLVRDTCDLIVSIPISEAVESLNAAVATGIALYAVDRQRQAGK